MYVSLVLSILILVFLLAVGITRYFKEMRDDSTTAGLFLLKVAIPLGLIGLVVLFNYSSE